MKNTGLKGDQKAREKERGEKEKEKGKAILIQLSAEIDLKVIEGVNALPTTYLGAMHMYRARLTNCQFIGPWRMLTRDGKTVTKNTKRN